MAGRAVGRYKDNKDTVQNEYAERLFADASEPVSRSFAGDVQCKRLNHHAWLELAKWLKSLLVKLQRISDFTPVPDRNKAKFRFYCDNDAGDPSPDSKTRWKLKKDPPPDQRPGGYVLQADRASFDEASYQEPRQEWEDELNDM
ncbi:MAG: hypothetical protein Q9227_007393 [Pyrenula ochraceoflavens]